MNQFNEQYEVYINFIKDHIDSETGYFLLTTDELRELVGAGSKDINFMLSHFLSYL